MNFVKLNWSDLFLLKTVDAFGVLTLCQVFFELIFFVGCMLVNHIKSVPVMRDNEAQVELAENVELLKFLLF